MSVTEKVNGRATYDAARLQRARWATGTVFVLLGAVQGTLASRMPALKDHAGLSDGLLGLALLGVPVGSVLAIQVTGRWTAVKGTSPVTRIGALIMLLATALPAYAPGFGTFLGALIVVGIGMGLTDAAMNAHAVTVERAYARPIMSSFHGFASLGMLLGALLGALAARLHLGPQLHFPLFAGVGLVVAVAVGPLLLPGVADAHQVDPEQAAPARRAPWSGTLALLAGIALLAWMSEHAIADWSAVYLRDRLGAPGSVAPYGYALFAVAMVTTRFLVDRVTARLGPRRVLRFGGLVAGLGLAAGLASDTVVGTVIGFGLVGVGMAGVVPIVFTAAGNLPGVHAGGAVSKVAGVAYAGSLLGPPVIGLTAEVTSLQVALFLVAAASLAIGLAGPLGDRRRQPVGAIPLTAGPGDAGGPGERR